MPTSIFNMPSASSTSPPPKIHFTHSTISSKYLDPTQPPTKTNPFQQINNIPFVRDLRICMPLRVWKTLYPDSGSSSSSNRISSSLPILKHSKVSMTLKDILDDEDLRRGDYLFLSRPSSTTTTDTTISLSRGTLTVTMPQHVYQRSGLTFPTTKAPSGGRKHDPRAIKYRVELDLRSPSIVRGKKGFDRIMYAAKNVEGLSEIRQWWFCEFGDVSGNQHGTKKRKRGVDGDDDGTVSRKRDERHDGGQTRTDESLTVETEDKHPLSKFNPIIKTTAATRITFKDVLLPSFIREPSFFSSIPSSAAGQQAQKGNLPTILEDDIYDIVEYLSLVFHRSPRIVKSQYRQIDSYLCQYILPDVSPPTHHTTKHPVDDIPAPQEAEEPSEDLVIVSYAGFIPSAFVTQVLVDFLRRSRSTKPTEADLNAWAALNIVAHPSETTGSSDGLMILLQGDSHVSDKQRASVGRNESVKTVPAEDETDLLNGNKSEMDDSAWRGLRHATCFEFVDNLEG